MQTLEGLAATMRRGGRWNQRIDKSQTLSADYYVDDEKRRRRSMARQDDDFWWQSSSSSSNSVTGCGWHCKSLTRVDLFVRKLCDWHDCVGLGINRRWYLVKVARISWTVPEWSQGELFYICVFPTMSIWGWWIKDYQVNVRWNKVRRTRDIQADRM